MQLAGVRRESAFSLTAVAKYVGYLSSRRTNYYGRHNCSRRAIPHERSMGPCQQLAAVRCVSGRCGDGVVVHTSRAHQPVEFCKQPRRCGKHMEFHRYLYRKQSYMAATRQPGRSLLLKRYRKCPKVVLFISSSRLLFCAS
jgi:hypothetical protein